MIKTFNIGKFKINYEWYEGYATLGIVRVKNFGETEDKMSTHGLWIYLKPFLKNWR
jgi:hypothetical protein